MPEITFRGSGERPDEVDVLMMDEIDEAAEHLIEARDTRREVGLSREIEWEAHEQEAT